MTSPACRQIDLGNGLFAVIDECDWEAAHTVGFSCGLIWTGCIADHPWRPLAKGHTTYARVCLHGSLELRLHRVIADATRDQIVDHIDGNGLNCIRSNLRVTDFTGNARNRRKGDNCTSRYKGVALHKQSGKWSAQIKVRGEKKHLGLFPIEEDAARAYDAAAIAAFGEFASLNFPIVERRSAARTNFQFGR